MFLVAVRACTCVIGDHQQIIPKQFVQNMFLSAYVLVGPLMLAYAHKKKHAHTRVYTWDSYFFLFPFLLLCCPISILPSGAIVSNSQPPLPPPVMSIKKYGAENIWKRFKVVSLCTEISLRQVARFCLK